ncbi:unnamed protein product, partial [Meganyctiphanes norvegica]
TVPVGYRCITQMDDLECQICFNIFNSETRRPRTLICGHIFCQICLTREIANGKSTCATCRRPHNAQRIEDLPVCILVERLIEKFTKTSNEGAKSCNSEADDDEDDYSEGPCSKHKKSVVYFYCNTHSLNICRECTVIDHQVNTCNIISFEERLGKKKDDNIFQANSTATDIDETLSAIDGFVKEKNDIISNQELKIKQLKKTIEEALKAIEEARKTIDSEKIACDKAQTAMSNGKIRRKQIDSAKDNLQKANTKKTICNCNNDIETEEVNVEEWIKDVSAEFDLLRKTRETPSNILRALKCGRVIFTETAVNGRKAIAKLTSKGDKLHLHNFQNHSSPKGATTFPIYIIIWLFRRVKTCLLIIQTNYKCMY